MNVLEFSQFDLKIGKADHIFINATASNKAFGVREVLLDTGFSLGLAFDFTLMTKFGFKEGFLSNVVLADATVARAFTFIVDIIIPKDGQIQKLGAASVIFLKGCNEPIAGIELLKLISPLRIDWTNASVLWGSSVPALM